MSLATVNTVLRWLIAFACLAAFAFDMFFVYVHKRYKDVIFGWQFYAQTPLVGILFWIIVLSPNSRRQRKREQQLQQQLQQQAQKDEVSQHASYLPTTTPLTSTSVHYIKKRRTTGDKVWSVIRFLLVWCISAAILDITAKTIQKQLRFVYRIPILRNSPQAEAINYEFGIYDPRNLYECPTPNGDDLPSFLCNFNQQVINLATLAAGMAAIEAILTLILQCRPKTIVATTIVQPAGQQLPMAEVDPILQAELGHAHIVAIPSPVPSVPAPPPVPQVPLLFGAYHPTPEASPSMSGNRPLPPVPPHFASGDDDGTGTSSGYIHPAVAKPAYDAQAEKQGASMIRDEKESAAGPSHAYPADIKRADGS
ncbi:hypothetical protein BGX34_006257 [Mortierella sp. NVP85]|nr:hypothetical protein BGX34_006257 [Mortierella sp. NVP85]